MGFSLGMSFPLGISPAGSMNLGVVRQRLRLCLRAILPVLFAQAWGFQVVFFPAALGYGLALAAVSNWG